MIHILNAVTVLHNLMATGRVYSSIDVLLLLRVPNLHRLLNEFLVLQAQVDCQNEAPEKAFVQSSYKDSWLPDHVDI